MKFTCIECENHYTPDVDGDAEERTCYNCLDGITEHGFLEEEIKWKKKISFLCIYINY